MSRGVILCVDPDDDARAETVSRLEAATSDLNVDVVGVGTQADAMDAVETKRIACLITERSLPDGTGERLIARMREISPDTGCFLFTAAPPDEIATGEATITEYVRKGSPRALDRLAQLVVVTVEREAQTSYPIPQNERERREALRSYDLHDDALVDALDRVTDLAADHFGVPLSSVNILEEHSQEFLVCHGVEEPWEPMDRQSAVCTFTVLEDDGVMRVRDLQADPRFAGDERLDELGFRAYMGATLRTAAGLPIGTLCVYDTVPKTFTADDEGYLRELAAVAMDLIQAHNRGDGTPPTLDADIEGQP